MIIDCKNSIVLTFVPVIHLWLVLTYFLGWRDGMTSRLNF